MWTVEKIEKLGFKLISNHKLWCHFRNHAFDVMINLDTKVTKGNKFNFKCLGGRFGGNFSATIENEEEFKLLLKMING